MTNLTIDSSPNETLTRKNSVIKLLIFKVGKLTLALPILQVQKVVKHNATHGSGLSHVNLAHLIDQDIAIIDLHQKLFKTSLIESAQTQGYFIISKNLTGEPLGILVAEAPILLDVPAAQIRVIPESYRRADTLEIASHVAVIPQADETSMTVFILDLKHLV